MLQAAERNVLFVLDASGSMWGQVEGKHKIQVAREVLNTALSDLDENTAVGLMTYGHRRKGDCADIEVIAAVGQPRQLLLKAMNELNPKGKTPLSASLSMAAGALREVEGAVSVVLVSDGLETCSGDPCAAAKAAVESGVEMSIHVIGFDVSAEEAKQLQCIADNGNGKYFSADNAAQLSDALSQVVEVVPEPEPAPAPEAPRLGTLKFVTNYEFGSPYPIRNEEGASVQGKAIRDGGKEIDLPPGKYQLFWGELGVWVEVKAGGQTEVPLALIRYKEQKTSKETYNLVNIYEVSEAKARRVNLHNANGLLKTKPIGVYEFILHGTKTRFGNLKLGAGEFIELEVGFISAEKSFGKGNGAEIFDPDTGKRFSDIDTKHSYPIVPGRYLIKSPYPSLSEDDTEIEIKAGEEFILK